MKSSNLSSRIKRKAGRTIRKAANALDPVSTKHANHFLNFFWPGHYYTPIPDPADIEKNRALYFNDSQAEIPGVDLNIAGQCDVVARLGAFAADYSPAVDAKTAAAANERYFLGNGFFDSLDSYAFYGMLRLFEPGHVMEVGSGFSSALALDVSGRFLQSPPRMTFIDPYPERLLGLLRAEDTLNTNIITQPVQQTSAEVFAALGKNDILFIDSSHVAKIGSDVNYLFLDILPRIKSGVIIHVHDIFWPFEYPEAWYNEGRCWNESYLLRAILAAGSRYEILHFNSYLSKRQRPVLDVYPVWATKDKGASIWLRVR